MGINFFFLILELWEIILSHFWQCETIWNMCFQHVPNILLWFFKGTFTGSSANSWWPTCMLSGQAQLDCVSTKTSGCWHDDNKSKRTLDLCAVARFVEAANVFLLGHKYPDDLNIKSLCYVCVFAGRPVMIVVEYMENGSLDSFLRVSATVTVSGFMFCGL